ncbi:MAG: NAD(P)/FAD-dependent oxidoreductase [Rhizomicrobium sp.]
MDVIDCVVVGAGVVGLAIARALALSGCEVLVLEGERHFGTWTSARNSEVIHAGIYYSQGSLKAELCVEGRDRLYAFCAARGVPHKRCGKLIVAADEGQCCELERIAAAARANGVSDLQELIGAAAKALEPHVACVAALLSPSTGIIDSHAYMLALLGEAEANGAQLVCDTHVEHLERIKGGWHVWFGGSDEPLAARCVVNSAGLAAQALAQKTDGLAAEFIPPLHLAKGIYLTYSGRAPFQHLIYPLPEAGGLGAHLTLDMAGQARFGPDVEWVDAIDYTVDLARQPQFEAAIRRLWPDADMSRLAPGYAGIRPKLSGPGEPAADFVISGPEQHGLEGLVNLFGIESPGLTASLAIAERAATHLCGSGLVPMQNAVKADLG